MSAEVFVMPGQHAVETARWLQDEYGMVVTLDGTRPDRNVIRAKNERPESIRTGGSQVGRKSAAGMRHVSRYMGDFLDRITGPFDDDPPPAA